jgi:hypothetical protein
LRRNGWEQLLDQIRLVLLILLIGIVFSGIVVLISRFEKKNQTAKYLPAIVLLAAGVAFIVKARWFSEGMEGLGYIIFSMLAFGGFILTLITAVVITVVKKAGGRK